VSEVWESEERGLSRRLSTPTPRLAYSNSHRVQAGACRRSRSTYASRARR
jgi:hypothetical protein